MDHLTHDQQEALEQQTNTILIKELEHEIDEHTARIKHCLQALMAAGVSFDCETGVALQELGSRMIQVIHHALSEEEEE